MFDNLLNQNLYIQEVIDPKTKKEYLVHVYFSVANTGLLKGFHCAEFYITDKDPYHGVRVNFGNQAFSPEEFEAEKATDILGRLIEAKLPNGIKRFEAIMSHGIAGNELEF